jgi:signal recognition particle receptor subunit beta
MHRASGTGTRPGVLGRERDNRIEDGTATGPTVFKERLIMAVYNYAGGEVNIKIVYYGPGLSGKTTNLEFMYSKLPRENKGKMVSMKTRTDRTLFFDFLPIEVGELGGLNVRFLLYTVPGQVYYNATRKLVLKGVDAVVFVADSSPDRLDDDRESLSNLEENLNEIGHSLSSIPWVMQYNKRDVKGCMATKLLEKELNSWNAPSFEAVAVEGKGVYETFEGIAKLVFKRLSGELKNQQSRRDEGGKESTSRTSVDAEVVAHSSASDYNSEAGESETSGYAEEREEEHESVSEFVDSVLTEKGRGEASAEDLGATMEGYEEYGHIVELGENGGKTKLEDGSKHDKAGVAVVQGEEDDKEGFINDPLEKIKEDAGDVEEDSEPTPAGEDEKRPTKMVKVPLELTEEEIRNEVPVKVVLDIKIYSD